MSGSELYSLTLVFDKNVRKVWRQVDPGPRRPASAAIPKFPRAYYRFVERADDDTVDEFWSAIYAKDYTRAQALSGLKPSEIVGIIASIHDDGRTSGAASGEEYYFGPIKLHIWLDAVRNHPDRLVRRYWTRYANAGTGPPWEGLPERARQAFEQLAVLYNLLAGE